MNHDQLLGQVERLRGACRDWWDQPGHGQARNVEQNIDRLVSDIRAKKAREALDADIRNVIGALQRVDEEVMDHHHSNQLASMCENLRSQASKL